jgi:tetratricopeptide (TPR) repeat protein
MNDDNFKGSYTSLYLNIAKCYEDLNDLDNARKHYELALSFTDLLPDDGYSKYPT